MSLSDYHERFAAVYDTFYGERDVAGEVGLATGLLGLDDRGGQDAHVLDFGCGTGSHVLAFAESAITATGFDTSPAMIARARAKRPPPTAAKVYFETGGFADFCTRLDGCRFDAAVTFFNVLNCMDSPAAMLEHLKLLRGTLAGGAKLLADVWNGTAVFADAPQPDVRRYSVGNEPDPEIVRITVPKLDRVNQVCTLRYRVLTLHRGAGSFTEFESLHTLRFLTPVQYRHLFELAGFSVIDEFPNGRSGTQVTEHDWYISYLARADG